MLTAALNQIVNVATVPKRSPFRYPGGKTWLVPHVRRWLASLPESPSELVEPFAGGAIVGLTVACENLARHTTLIELDADVGSVWRTILNGKAAVLADRILKFDMTLPNVRRCLGSKPKTLLDRAFQTVLKNRVQHGGIMANGASLMNKGENGRGVCSRWYPATLAKRISDIAQVRRKICFKQADGLRYMMENRQRADFVWFIDPPYTIAGRRLYTHFVIDHEALFDIARQLRGDFLITYDKTPEVERWASKYGLDCESVPMKSRQHYKKSELLIGRNLEWARRS